jgi:thioredoxin 1
VCPLAGIMPSKLLPYRRQPAKKFTETRQQDDSHMITTRRTLIALAATILATPALAQSPQWPKEKFTLAAFEKAQASGKSIVVEVSAPWCPTCKVQAPIIESLLTKPEFKNVAVFEIDFDSQKDALRALNVRQQSTLVTFKGKTETGRSTGDTNPASIERLFRAAI